LLTLAAGAAGCKDETPAGGDARLADGALEAAVPKDGAADGTAVDLAPTDTGPVADRAATMDQASADRGSQADVSTVVDRGTAADRGAAADRGSHPDLATAADRGAAVDRGPAADLGTCFCKSGQVWLRGKCVPTPKLGTCAPACTAGSCSGTEVCDTCAAAPACTGSSCRAACVPGIAMGFAHNQLRVSPTYGKAGTAVTLTVQGGTFYIGAIWFNMRLGSGKGVTANDSVKCTLTATLTPAKAGIYPVEVQYQNGSYPWALAGFYTASAAGTAPGTVQPGYPCTFSSTCAQASPYTCSCVSGRCQCK
jgi:hypothetical protein